MARTSRRQLIRRVELLEPKVAREFERAIARIRSDAALSRISDLIDAGRFDEIASVLGINAARFSELAERLREAYVAGGQQGASELPAMTYGPDGRRARVAFAFNLSDPAAAAWVAENGGRLITAIVLDQRRMIIDVVRAGMAMGTGPRETALDIVGRIGESGRRTGGLVGLTADQAQYVTNARTQLLSGDPGQMRQYFDRTLRDRRFDGIVNRAIAAGQPVAAADVQRITARYADSLLRMRGETIARTETITAFNAAREEAFRQAIASGSLLAENVAGIWGATGDARTRHTHMAMNGQRKTFGEPFVSPSGARMMFPGDSSLGAGPGETINCRCTKIYRVDNVAEVIRGR